MGLALLIATFLLAQAARPALSEPLSERLQRTAPSVQTWLDTPVMLGAILAICILAFAMDLGLRQMDRRLALWKY